MLLLFDIDGTLLLRAADAHRDAMYEALRRVHGLSDPAAARVPSAGRTDADITRDILVCSGVAKERIDAHADDVRIAACEAYARLVPGDLSGHVAPGMFELLERLQTRDGVRLALVTGNFEAIARLKLRSAGLDAFFASGQGGFGSDHEDRTELPAIARRRAGEGAGAPWPRER
ncbi:MAG: HAD family hydrolase, partial [Solirubrobacterales bacterium]|nr:HAD family hydrolase [Solirubrobacterales bacterium]